MLKRVSLRDAFYHCSRRSPGSVMLRALTNHASSLTELL